MTRRDYERIADALANNIDDPTVLAQVIEALAPAFRQDNPRFDRERFRARVMHRITSANALVSAQAARVTRVDLSPVASRVWAARVDSPATAPADYVDGE